MCEDMEGFCSNNVHHFFSCVLRILFCLLFLRESGSVINVLMCTVDSEVT